MLALLPLPDFWITQLNYIALYSLVVLGLVLLTGIGGLTSFGQAAFVGIGAYTSAYLTVNMGWSPWLTVFVGLGLTAASALMVGWITLRMSGHYLPLATIAWGLSLYYLMGNLDALGKYDGILGVPTSRSFGWDIGQGRPASSSGLGRWCCWGRLPCSTCWTRAPAAPSGAAHQHA
jgi:branched-chain amino acid transport system permease protein